MNTSLVPDSVDTNAEARRPFGFCFGQRFFIALLIGLVWLIPAWWNTRFVAALFVWDALALCAWAWDLATLPAAHAISIERRWLAPPVLARRSKVELRISAQADLRHLHVADLSPNTMREEPPEFDVKLPRRGDPVRIEYEILPRERGSAEFGSAYLRYRSWLGLAERWAVARLSQTVTVLPDIVEAKDQALFLIRTRQVELEKRRKRQRGLGRDFESLREYRQGDELRDVCWSATARRHQLITRTYEAERSQAVWLILDAGRLLRARVESHKYAAPLAKLDYSVNAALSLAQVASQYGDRVGLLTYSRQIQATLNAGRGPNHIRALIECLAHTRPEAKEADHGKAARTLLQRQTRRSLVIWITDFAETPSTPDVVEHAAHLARRHLVVFAAVSQPDLAQLARKIPTSEAEMFRVAAALEIVHRRELLLRQLRHSGVLALELTPDALTSSLINEYLVVKDRSLL